MKYLKYRRFIDLYHQICRYLITACRGGLIMPLNVEDDEFAKRVFCETVAKVLQHLHCSEKTIFESDIRELSIYELSEKANRVMPFYDLWTGKIESFHEMLDYFFVELRERVRKRKQQGVRFEFKEFQVD